MSSGWVCFLAGLVLGRPAGPQPTGRDWRPRRGETLARATSGSGLQIVPRKLEGEGRCEWSWTHLHEGDLDLESFHGVDWAAGCSSGLHIAVARGKHLWRRVSLRNGIPQSGTAVSGSGCLARAGHAHGAVHAGGRVSPQAAPRKMEERRSAGATDSGGAGRAGRRSGRTRSFLPAIQTEAVAARRR